MREYGYEEQFEERGRKDARKERRIASLKDRSKYKKTDLEKVKREAPEGENLKRGRVLAIAPEGIVVDVDHRLYTCGLKGALKKESSRVKNLVAVGDFVRIEPKGEKEGSIAFVEERRSVLSRAEHLQQRKQQLIAVNIDQVLITTSVLLPQLKPSLVDRYIIAARKGNMEPLIVINKIDLLTDPPQEVSSALLEEERVMYADFLKTYRALGIPIFAVSAHTGEGMEKLKAAMAGKSSVFSGQSGTGKSSLINLLTGSSQEIGDIVSKTGKGAHTTTTTHLIPIEGGGFCIDTPGIKSFGLWDLTPKEVQLYFSEIHERGKKCKYDDCSHLTEPECAVQKGVEKGKISPLRFASYSALIADLAQEHKPR